MRTGSSVRVIRASKIEMDLNYCVTDKVLWTTFTKHHNTNVHMYDKEERHLMTCTSKNRGNDLVLGLGTSFQRLTEPDSLSPQRVPEMHPYPSSSSSLNPGP